MNVSPRPRSAENQLCGGCGMEVFRQITSSVIVVFRYNRRQAGEARRVTEFLSRGADDARSDLRLLGGLLCEPSRARSGLSRNSSVLRSPRSRASRVRSARRVREVSDNDPAQRCSWLSLDPSKEHRPSPKDEAM